MVRISFSPINELVVHEVVKVSMDDLMRERITPSGTMPLYWCNGLLFSFGAALQVVGSSPVLALSSFATAGTCCPSCVVAVLVIFSSNFHYLLLSYLLALIIVIL
jgi:hypothetical protein